MAEDNDAVLEAAKGLPFAERATHKAWFVRAAAYEDIATGCKKALEPSDRLFAEVGPIFVKGVVDANPNAVDKCLDALLAFLQNTSEAQVSRISGPTCYNIATKVLKGRPGTVKRASDVFLMFVEWEQVDEVLEPLFKAFGDKIAKTVVAALDIVTQAFSLFGPKVVKPQAITKALPTLFDAKQEPVREGVKRLAVELRAWLGADYVQGSLCGKMPDLMRKDVEKLIADYQGSKTQPERYTRKEQAAREAAAEAAGPSREEHENGAAGPASSTSAGSPEPSYQEVDSYEYAEPADIWSSLNKEFWEGLASKKWSERRDSLQKLKGLASQPKVASGDSGDVLRELKKIILKDSNVVCVGEALLCVGALAKSMRNSFSGQVKGFVALILEKYKDPKTSISTAVTESLTQIQKYCLTLSDLAEDLCAALSHKNPKIKVDTAKLLQKCIDNLAKKDVAKVQPVLLPVVAQGANDPAPDVREANMGILVSFAVKAGNVALLDKVSDGFDDVRKKRLNELAQQRTSSSVPVIAVPESNARSVIPPKSPSKPATRASSTRTANGISKPAAPKAALKKSQAAAAADAGPADNDNAALAGGTLSDTELKEHVQALLGEEIYTGLLDGQWKARLASMEGFMDWVKGKEELSAETASLLVQGIAVVPGWSEKNFQVLGKAFDIISYLVANSSVTKKDAFTAMGGLVEKMPDIKLKTPAGEAMFAISEALGPQFTITQLHKKASAHKNPKVLSESLMWIAKAVEDFGLGTVNVQQLIEFTTADLASTNAAVRNAATYLMATCHKQLGPDLAAMIRNNVKPALMTSLEDAFKKNPKTQIVLTRTVRNASKPKRGAANGRAASGSGEAAKTASPDVDDLLPRIDVSPQLGPKIIASLGSANWKERNHTMEDIENIIRGAARIQPSVGDLIPSLKARLADTNKNLVAKALTLFGELAKAMGPAWERVGKPILPQAVGFFADNKKQVRDAAVGALDNWVTALPPEKVLPTVVDFLAGSKASAEGKVTAIQWLKTLLEANRLVKCIDQALKAAAVISTDKAVEVREVAVQLATLLAESHSQEIGDALEALSGATKKAAAELLNKQGVKPAAVAPPATVAQNGAAGMNGAATARIPPLSIPETTGNPKSSTRAPRPSPSKIGTTSMSSSRENNGPNTPADEPCLLYSNKKAERLQRARFKPTRFEAPTPNDILLLEDELGPLVSDHLRDLLFSKDFRRHMEAADIIILQLVFVHLEAMSCMDLLLRWVVIRICDANTQALLRILDLTKALFNLMISKGYKLSDAEAHATLPVLVEKSGHNTERLRQYNREVIKMSRKLLTSGRVTDYLVQGFTSKNNRTRVDCVELLGQMLEEEGLNACLRTKLKPFALMAELVTVRGGDKSLRLAVLDTLEILYKQQGESMVWAQVGAVTPQQKSLIEERFKTVVRSQARQQTQARLDGPPNASDHSSAPASPMALGLSSRDGRRSGSRGSTDFGLPIPAVTMTRQYSSTPPSRTHSAKENIPVDTPEPAATPAQRVLPPAIDIEALYRRDDEDNHKVFTEGLIALTEASREKNVEGAKCMCFVLANAAEDRVTGEFKAFLAHSSTELLKALTRNIDTEFNAVVRESARSHGPVNGRGCKYFVNATMMVFDVKGMSKSIPMEALKDLIFVLLSKLLDESAHRALEDNPDILKAVNILMLKMISNNFGNTILEALIQLLMVPEIKLMDRNMDKAAFNSLLTKCLIKAARHLKESYRDLDIAQLLMVIHHYFMSLGVDEIRRRGAQDEKSLRMVKSILHEITKLLGENIRQYMTDIPRREPMPLIHIYVDLHLCSLHQAGYIEPPFEPPPEVEMGRAASMQEPSIGAYHPIHQRSASMQLNHQGSLRSSREVVRNPAPAANPVREVLLPILQRIGDGSTSEQGLEDLHRFLNQHPHAETASIMSKLSPDFYAFLEKGLRRIDRREDTGPTRLSGRLSSGSSTSLGTATSIDRANGTSSDSIMQGMETLRLSSSSARNAPVTMSEVEQMQERMRSLRRSAS